MPLDHGAPGGTAAPIGPGDRPDYTPASWPDPVPLAARTSLDALGTQLIPPAERSLFTRTTLPELTAPEGAGELPAVPPAAAAPAPGPVPAGPTAVAAPAGPTATPAPATPAPAGPGPGPQRGRALRLPFAGGTEARRRQLVERTRTPLLGCHRIALLGPPADARQAGIAVALGAQLARYRPDRVVVLDLAAPYPGGPGTALPHSHPQAHPHPHAERWAGRWALGELFAAAPLPAPAERPAGTLEVLTLRPDLPPPALDAARYRQALGTLSGDYPLILSDASAAPDDVQQAAAGLADRLVICAGASAAGARAASAQLERLTARGPGGPADSIVVFVPAPPAASGSDRPVAARDLAEHFGARCRGVVVLPADRRSAPADPWSRSALLELTALIGDGLPAPHPGP
ncbi:hypothetical protein OH807_35885 [Kitasatospora sp. NBC_01560]|uniref:hypothetical protein n=1 Tax=Kitasatospora sp. NBC_01560 TaxID=2975965 RepID=UPI003865869F